jgi:hypothetical protein
MANVARSPSLRVGQTSASSYDLSFLVSAGLVSIGIIFAVYALAMSSGVSANDLALMTAYP